MSFKESHALRVTRLRDFISGNKLFLALAAMAVMLLLSGSFFFNRVDETAAPEETVETQEADDLSWRFYPIDAVILLVGGGFCTVMIIRERHKAKEELN